jgi:hypothetical protein
LWLEDFTARYQHSIALIEAISTTVAVVVALWASYYAKRASRPKLKSWISVSQIIFGDGSSINKAPTYITVRITNIGSVPLRLHSTFFSWRLPFTKTAWLAMPVDEHGDKHVAVRSYPFTLLPNTSAMFFLTSIEQFRSYTPRMLNSGRFGRWLSTKFLRGSVYTDDGSLFKAAFDGNFRKELADLASKKELADLASKMAGGIPET